VTGTAPGPTISSLNPTAGPVDTSVTITGTNFGTAQGWSIVTFNGIAALATSWSNTSITAMVPSGATTGNVVVTVVGFSSNGVNFTVGESGPTVYYYIEDSLGTSRVMTTSTGVVCYDADFAPFGQENALTQSCTQNNYKFEGKERDSETGNDEFGARYYSWRWGRWLSADWSSVPEAVPYANLTNPQTLNLYAMVADDPESFADLDGHMDCSGDNAQGAGCLYLASWDTLHGVTENTNGQNNQANAATQNQRSGKSTGMATFNLGGVPVDFRWATYGEADGIGGGVLITATPRGCDTCVWAQTVSGSDIKGGTKADTQPGADPKRYPFTGSTEQLGQLWDRPERSSAPAGLSFVSTMGVADGNTFNVKGSLTWGFSVNERGDVKFSGVRPATADEQRGSLTIWRRATGMGTGP
jgi:RHS repeat-associated protein